MSDGKRIIRPIISVTLVVLTVLGLNNVYSDNSELRKLAEQTACGSEPCATHLLEMQRSPIAQSFRFQTGKNEGEAMTGERSVRCQREFVFLGEYACAVQ